MLGTRLEVDVFTLARENSRCICDWMRILLPLGFVLCRRRRRLFVRPCYERRRLCPPLQDLAQLSHIATERCLIVQASGIDVRKLHLDRHAWRMQGKKLVQGLVVRQ